MYPVNMLMTLDEAGCEKFVKALSDVKYKGMKERNRLKLIGVCKKEKKLEGTMKEWVQGFVFFGAISTRDKIKKHSILKFLDKGGPMPSTSKYLKVKQQTHLYKPDDCKEATYYGRLRESQLAKDLANLLLMDMLNANEDRFPGANIEFKSLGSVREASKCVFDFGDARLFSLDNGATFKGSYSNAMVDFTKRLPVTRFSKRIYTRLKAIAKFIGGSGRAPLCLRRWGITTVDELWEYVALDKGDSHRHRKQPWKLFETTLKATLKYIDSVGKDKRAWYP